MVFVKAAYLILLVVASGCGATTTDPLGKEVRPRGPKDTGLQKDQIKILAKEAACITKCSSCDVRVMPVECCSDIGPDHWQPIYATDGVTHYKRYYVVLVGSRGLAAPVYCDDEEHYPNARCRSNDENENPWNCTREQDAEGPAEYGFVEIEPFLENEVPRPLNEDYRPWKKHPKWIRIQKPK
jgi:hypothetical protein